MNLLVWISVAYLLCGLAILWMMRSFRKQRGEEDLGLIDLLVILLVGPLTVFAVNLWMFLYPPSSDPFQLIYSRLSFSLGKTSGKILDEIRAAQETVGGGYFEEATLGGHLDYMVKQGFAIARSVPIIELTEDQVSESEVVFDEDVAEEGKPDASKLEPEPEEEETITLYFRGIPPSKRGKWQWRLQPLLNPMPAR